MVTVSQFFTVLGILCAPMITIATVVLTLAALNLSLGLRRLYVRILAFIFDYATKIKRDRETTHDGDGSTDEMPRSTDPIVQRSSDDPIDPTGKEEMKSVDEAKGAAKESGIQFRLGKKSVEENVRASRRRSF